MKRVCFSVLASCLIGANLFIAAPVSAQASDTATERARLGEQRARAEAERRARQEAEQRELEQQALRSKQQSVAAQSRSGVGPAAVPALAAPAESAMRSQNTNAAVVDPDDPQPPGSSAVVAPAVANGAADVSESYVPRPDEYSPSDREAVDRVLEQLRELGELKDAGYVTDDEFARIKQRILEDQL